MRPYETVLIPMVNTTFFLLPAWIIAAWAASHAARCKTRNGLRLTALLGFISMLAIVVLNVWRIWIITPIFQRGFGMLSPNYAARLVFVHRPAALMLIWGVPALWKALRASSIDDNVRASL